MGFDCDQKRERIRLGGVKWFRFLYDFLQSKLVLFVDGEEDRLSSLGGLVYWELTTKTPVVFLTPPQYLIQEYVDLSGNKGILKRSSTWKEAGEKVQSHMLHFAKIAGKMKGQSFSPALISMYRC